MNNTAAAIHSPLFLPSFFFFVLFFRQYVFCCAQSFLFLFFFGLQTKKGRPLHWARDRAGKVGHTAPSRRPIFAIF